MNSTHKNPITYLFYIIAGILILSGIIIAVKVNLAAGERENLKNTYVETQGIIDSVETNMVAAESTEKVVLAHYEVDGKVYDNVRIYDFPATVRKGDSITIYYDPENPKVIIQNPGKGSIFGANAISLILVVAGFAALVFSGKFTKSRSDINYESRFKPYDEYGGETTERAGTLFDREVDPSELVLDDPTKHRIRRRQSRHKKY